MRYFREPDNVVPPNASEIACQTTVMISRPSSLALTVLCAVVKLASRVACGDVMASFVARRRGVWLLWFVNSWRHHHQPSTWRRSTCHAVAMTTVNRRRLFRCLPVINLKRRRRRQTNGQHTICQVCV